MTASAITFELADGVAWLTLARPDRRNAIGPEIARALHEAADLCADDPAIRCVVLTGSGRFFSVGGDIDVFSEAGGDVEAIVLDLAHSFHAGVHRLATMDKPLVTAINGPAAGAGLSLAILGDIAIAAASAHFTSAYSAIGLTPDGGASWWLPRLVGLRRAQEIVLTNRRIDASEAAAIGLITRVTADEDLIAAVREVAVALASGPTRAIGRCRRLLLASATSDLATQLEAEANSIAATAGGSEGREGVKAFLAKRPAVFPNT
ncbi:enoyl-CoA hydratase-related protein [Sphingomonas sp. H39-1-10]|uniref:enoyl-CoA hydratase/isomerase family protein n=1 Tax=Sphingomonas pollutisoli TaxID=3030829 RepID=UPI0023B90997|nr:enoyl-CoA hydratase-related protein [Sphingomonas pollutisoli]MDF0487502.1 enoyl-CoA hydratase-related protein [Sphingomonas pollutisoli]